jgi:predicted permease
VRPRNEIEEELQFHIEARAADLERRGKSPEEALREARLEFGSVARYVEESREATPQGQLAALVGMLERATRPLRRDWAFQILHLAALATGIAAVTVVLSLGEQLIWHPTTYPHAERIYSARTRIPSMRHIYDTLPASVCYYEAWRKQCRECERIALIGVGYHAVGTTKERVFGFEVTPSFFAMTGAKALMGRLFAAGEEGPNSPPLVVLTEDYWRAHLGAKKDVIGTRLGDWTVIGVVSRELQFPKGTQLGSMMHAPPHVDVLLPQRADSRHREAAEQFKWAAWIEVKPGVDVSRLEAKLSRWIQPFGSREREGLSVELVGLNEAFAMGVNRWMRMLVGGAGIVLLVICLNFGNIQIARWRAMRRDLAVRAAMGGSPVELMRVAMGEGVMVAGCAALVALGLALGAMTALRQASPNFLPPVERAGLNGWIWFAVSGMVMLAGILCVAASAAREWEQLRWSEARGAEGGSGLLVPAAAVSVGLTILSVLMLLGYARLRREDPGFTARGLWSLCISTPAGIKEPYQIHEAHQRMLGKLRAMPQVKVAANALSLPLFGEIRLDAIGRPENSGGGLIGSWRHVSVGYFDAVGTKILMGRQFEPHDEGRHVVVISERVAKEVFAYEDPLGKVVLQNEPWGTYQAEVIGVAANVKSQMEANAPPMVYVPLWTAGLSEVYYAIRSDASGEELLPQLRAAVKAAGMHLTEGRTTLLEAVVDSQTGVRRWHAIVTAGFAVTAVWTACLSLFMLVRNAVASRRGEIGIRIALGSTRKEAARMLLKDALRPIVVAIPIGAGMAYGIARLHAFEFYGVSPAEPWAFVGAVGGVMLVAAGAALCSIRQLSWFDMGAALRSDCRQTLFR